MRRPWAIPHGRAKGLWANRFWYPAGLGALGSTQMLVLAGPTLDIAPWALAFLGLSLVVAYVVRDRSAPQPAAVAAAPAGIDAARGACLDSFDLWTRQIETSRATANEAVLRLTQIFEGTVAKLESALAAARKTLVELRGRDGVIEAASHGDDDLRRAMQALVAAHRTRESRVGVHARDLRDMASQVQKIALQIRMLSFNAAIEAARAGEAAGGFAVVAAEMRQLAAVSGETGASMVKKVEVINATLEDLVRADHAGAGREADTVAEAEHVIRAVTERFATLARELSAAVKDMEAKTGEVHGDISEALVALQFQDRVNQIQQHVVSGLGALRRRLERGDEQALAAAHWQSRIERDLSTDEEFANLRGGARPALRPTETTFF